MFSPAYNQQLIENKSNRRFYKDAIARKTEEIFELLEQAGFITEIKDDEGIISEYTLGLPETLPSISWYSSPFNWVNKQFTTFVRFPVVLAPQPGASKTAFRRYAEKLIREQYIDDPLDNASTDKDIEDILQPFLPGTLSQLAASFSKIFSETLGLQLILKPSASTSAMPPHYIIEGHHEPLTTDQKIKILNWCITHQPTWVLRWWRDHPFDTDLIKIDPQGRLCIESFNLLKMTLLIDPALPPLLNALGHFLSKKYNKEIIINLHDCFRDMNVFLNNKNYNSYDHASYKQFQNDVYESTQCRISAGSSCPITRYHPLSVTPYKASLRSDTENDPANNHPITGTIQKRFDRQFIAKYIDLESKGIFFSINDLRTVLAMAKLEAPVYLPLNPSHVPENKSSIQTHPMLAYTKWRLLGVVSGVGADFSGKHESNNEDWSEDIKKALGWTSPKTLRLTP